MSPHRLSALLVVALAMAAPASALAADTAPPRIIHTAPATAPSYISFQGAVFAVGAAVTDTSAVDTTVLGTVLSAFASATDTPASAAVFKSPAADESIVVRTPQGLQSFAPVVRSK